MVAICIVLVIVCVLLIVYIYSLKKQVSNIGRELKITRQKEYNRQLKIALFDDDIEKMAVEINNNLDYQKQMKLEAEKSRRQLKQSVSDIAHDLRTPLTVVKGNLFILEKEEHLSSRGKESLRISIEKTDALKNMVDDFFELSVFESDSSLTVLEKVDATAYITQFVIDNEAVIRQHGLSPRLKLPEKSVFIKADKMLLTRMCNNLLNNVFKYAKDEFTLELGSYIGKWDFEAETLSDTYLEKDKLAKERDVEIAEIIFSNKVLSDKDFDVNMLFDRTYRGDKARPSGGAGLGLYIVKLLAHKQGAKVSATMNGDSLSIKMEFPVEFN